MPLFQDSQYFSINGGVFNDYSTVTYGLGPLAYLQQSAASSASHDSQERYPPQKCHIETRGQALHHILTWARLPRQDRRKSVYWLYAPAGMGKTAIAQSVAEQCEELGLLGATFFFFRLDASRNRAEKLVASIAVHLCESLPDLKPHVEQVILSTPTILTKSLPTQLQKLIVEPLKKVPQPEGDRIVIIDGLDECIGPDPKEVDPAKEQRLVLEMIDTLQSFDLPLAFLIVSRPESWIKHGFKALPRLLNATEAVDLYDISNGNQDIEIYLRSEFTRIREGSEISSQWPSDKDILDLIKRASGQFIYATTVIRYVDNPWSSPKDRLKTILASETPPDHNPLETLDTLYLTILQQSPNHELTREVLSLLIFSQVLLSNNGRSRGIQSSQTDICQHMFNLPPYALRGLHSLVRTEGNASNNPFYHTTFAEFLQSKHRSKQFSRPPEHDTIIRILRTCFALLASSESVEMTLCARDSRVVSSRIWVSLWWFLDFSAVADPLSIMDELVSCNFGDLLSESVEWTGGSLRRVCWMPLRHYRDPKPSILTRSRARNTMVHLHGLYDAAVVSQLSRLDSDFQEYLKRLIVAALTTMPHPAAPAGMNLFTIHQDEESGHFNLQFEGRNVGDMLTSAALGYCVEPNRALTAVFRGNSKRFIKEWQRRLSLMFLQCFRDDFIAFLADPARSGPHGWNIIKHSQLVSLTSACFQYAFTEYGPIYPLLLRSFGLLTLINKSVNDVLPTLTALYRLENYSDKPVDIGKRYIKVLADGFNFYWAPTIIICLLLENAEMATLVADVCESLYNERSSDISTKEMRTIRNDIRYYKKLCKAATLDPKSYFTPKESAITKLLAPFKRTLT
ncbi:hypothetical protein FA15DRAFT_635958 [Coprinopsis marcescibilis]|uniref:Nephrocystin 3-like N-terminal domain-containing protein n=1 Tax=Coprinopsis marcescibilis TaxID=230819 RepID=A0A5C3L534_COPMA|nr:hypothetical protein FA15DRAFT_635958 [Coprinopsis marcescibilis]